MNKLASLSGLDPRAIALIERGERSPALHTVLRITIALEVNLWEMLQEVEKSDDS